MAVISALLTGGLHISKRLHRPLIPRIRRDLKVSTFDMSSEETVSVDAYVEDDDYVTVPRSYGLSLMEDEDLGFETRVYRREMRRWPNMKSIALREDQTPFVDEIEQATHDYYDFTVKAATGQGKTVCALEIVRRLRRATLVVVDQTFLMDQWRERIGQFLGLTDDQVGVVQGSQCDYKGKAITIAMLQTIYNREYPPEFYKAFGLVIYDEMQVTGAEQFSRVLVRFAADCRFGLSATPKRRDGLQKVLDLSFGPKVVSLDVKHRKSSVRYVTSGTTYSWYANTSPKTGRFITEIAQDPRRNALLCEVIRHYYDKDRDILVVSDRITQLENLMSQCALQGMDINDMGLVTGFRHEYRYAKDPAPSQRQQHLFEGAAYSPVKLQLVEKRNPRKLLDEKKENCRVLFVTYSIFAKGVDIPRLSVGIDCTPRAGAVQVHGRILRTHANKKRPVWVTVRDINSSRAEHQFKRRLAEYIESNAEIHEWHLQRGVRKRDVTSLASEVEERYQLLKGRRIGTTLDGAPTYHA